MAKKINYSLRPAKSIERRMLADIYAAVSRHLSFENAAYVGFGSFWFNDFRLFHNRFGIQEMHSIERDTNHAKRYDFNRPFGCVKVHMGHSNQVLQTLDSWSKPALIWLDYEGSISPEVLVDLETIARRLVHPAMLVVTLRADFKCLTVDKGEGETIFESRKRALSELCGETNVPFPLEVDALDEARMPKTFSTVMQLVLSRTFGERVAVGDASCPALRQLATLVYADETRMATSVFLIAPAADLAVIPAHDLEGLTFCQGEEVFEIVAPRVTFIEARAMARCLPGPSPEYASIEVPQADKEAFEKFYRYFPVFAEHEL